MNSQTNYMQAALQIQRWRDFRRHLGSARQRFFLAYLPTAGMGSRFIRPAFHDGDPRSDYRRRGATHIEQERRRHAGIMKEIYSFRVKGHLDQERSNWFDGLTIVKRGDSTLDDGNASAADEV